MRTVSRVLAVVAIAALGPVAPAAGEAAPSQGSARIAGLLGCVSGDTLSDIARHLEVSAPSRKPSAYAERYLRFGWSEYRERSSAMIAFTAGADGRNSVRVFDVPHRTMGAAMDRVTDCMVAG